ncbi:MAG: hypothetical protein HWN65_20980 [Candidatus Helarchaeota archaeon]|nr:hypothetical protein [Candidatus Helarchaeota archaeon]
MSRRIKSSKIKIKSLISLMIILLLSNAFISFIFKQNYYNSNSKNSEFLDSGTNFKISTILESSNEWVSEVIDYDINGGPPTIVDIVIADADDDGINEIAVCTYNGSFSIFLYDYNGTGWTKYQVDTGGPPLSASIDVGDADNDGDNEIVSCTGWSDISVYIYDGANGSWTETLVKNTNDANGDVKIADGDNDGKNEILVSSNKPGSNNYDRLLIINGSGSTWDMYTITEDILGGGSGVIQCGDADDDTLNEIVVRTSGPGGQHLYIVNGSGTTWDINLLMNDVTYSPIAIGDADNDGDNEILLGTREGAGSSRLILFDGAGAAWSDDPIDSGLNDIGSLDVGDALNEGKNQIIVGSGSGIFLYEKNGIWSDYNIVNFTDNVGQITIGDVYNNSYNEFLTNEVEILYIFKSIVNIPTPIVSITTPLESAIIRGQTIWINGTVGAGTGKIIQNMIINNSYFAIWDDPTGQASGSFSYCNNTVLYDGIYVINVTMINNITEMNSDTRSFTIDNTLPTTAAITSPSAGENVSGTIAITANATDNAGGSGVDYVEFWVDGIGTGTLIGTDSFPPYTVNWTPTSEGSHMVYVRVFDFAGNSNSSGIAITVQAIYNYADDFNSDILDPKWTWHPDSGSQASWSLTANPGNLRITCPDVAISWQSGPADVPYMYQALPSGDWEIVIKVNEPTANEFANGIILYKSSNEWLMYANHYDSVGEMNLLRGQLGGSTDNYAGGDRGNNHPYLKLKKVGITYSCYGSDDGNSWNYYGNVNTSIFFTQMGIWSQSAWSGTFISDFDYFNFTVLPPSEPEQPTKEYPFSNEWIYTWNDTSVDYFSHAVRDNNNNVYLIGGTNSSGVGNMDALLVKYDADGNQLWNKTFGQTGDDWACEGAVDGDNNIYIVGYFRVTAGAKADVFIVKYAPNGTKLWNTTWGTPTILDFGMGIAIDGSNLFVAGRRDESIRLIKFDLNGNEIWNKTWDGPYSDQGFDVAIDSDHNIYLGGRTNVNPDDNAVLIKFASNGTELWNKNWGDSHNDEVHGLTIDKNNFIYVTGFTKNPSTAKPDIFIRKYNSSGSLIWNRTWGGSEDDVGWGIGVDGNNDIYLSGYTSSFGAGQSDILFLKYDSEGNQIWNYTWGNSYDDKGYRMSIYDNYCYIAGQTNYGVSPFSDAVFLKYLLYDSPNETSIIWKKSLSYNVTSWDMEDINGDGISEIVAFSRQCPIVWVLNSSTGATLWSKDFAALYGDLSWGGYVSSEEMKVGDINNDSIAEIIVPSYNSTHKLIYAFDGWGTRLWTYAHSGAGRFESIALGDINGDGINDIAARSPDGEQVHVLRNDGSYLWTSGSLGWWGRSVHIENLYNLTNDNKIITSGTPNVRVYNNDFTSNWTSSYGWGDEMGMGFGDVDGDGFLEIAVQAHPEGAGPGESVVRVFEETGAIKWTYNYPTDYGSIYQFNAERPILLDIDNDNQNEILELVVDQSFTQIALLLFHGENSSPIWSYNFTERGIAVDNIGNVLGNTDQEIIVQINDTIYVFDLLGEKIHEFCYNGSYIIGYPLGPRPLIWDFDGDGYDEVCATNNGTIALLNIVNETIGGDWTAPTITVNTPSESYYNSPPIMDVDLTDAVSLDAGYYKVDSYTPTGSDTTGWTAIFTDHPSNSYTSNFTIASSAWNALSEGSHTVYFKAWDDANNVNDGASPSWQFYKDITPPQASNPSPADSSYTNDATPTIRVDLSDALSSINVSSIILIAGGVVRVHSWDGTTVSWTPGPPFPDGQVIDVELDASDLAGNAMPTYSWAFTIDNTPPSDFTIIGPSEVMEDDTPEVICRIFVAGAGINLSSIQYAYSITGSLTPTNWAPVDGVYWDAACTIPASDGATGTLYLKVNAVPFHQFSLTNNTIRFRASDIANNQGIQSIATIIPIAEEEGPDIIIIIIIIIIGAIAAVASTSYIAVRRRKPIPLSKIDKIKPLRKYQNTPFILAEEAEGLLEISNQINQFSLSAEEKQEVLMELQGLPPEERFTFFNTIVERMQGNRAWLQLYALLEEFAMLEKEGRWAEALQKLEKAIELAENLGDQEFFNNLLIKFDEFRANQEENPLKHLADSLAQDFQGSSVDEPEIPEDSKEPDSSGESESDVLED